MGTGRTFLGFMNSAVRREGFSVGFSVVVTGAVFCRGSGEA